MEQNPVVTIKKKNLHILIDYCVENRLEFMVKPKLSGDEFDVEVPMSSIHQAILFGMFLRENRLMPNGMQAQLVSTAKVKATKAQAEKTIEPNSASLNTVEEELKDNAIDLFDKTLNLNL